MKIIIDSVGKTSKCVVYFRVFLDIKSFKIILTLEKEILSIKVLPLDTVKRVELYYNFTITLKQ